MKIKVGISNHHLHLKEEDLKKLFGEEHKLEVYKPLKQPGQFASTSLLDIKTDKGVIKNVRVLGPVRPYTQVEISQTDAYKLGINPPVRDSGNLAGASLITIIGPTGEISKEAAIIANRHIHVNRKIREDNGLMGVEKVKVKISGEKGGILDDVYLKDLDEAYFELHLDTDDANAFLLKNDDEVEIIL